MYIWYWTNSYWNLQIWNLLEKDENILRVQLFFRALECDFAKINNNKKKEYNVIKIILIANIIFYKEFYIATQWWLFEQFL